MVNTSVLYRSSRLAEVTAWMDVLSVAMFLFFLAGLGHHEAFRIATICIFGITGGCYFAQYRTNTRENDYYHLGLAFVFWLSMSIAVLYLSIKVR